MFIDVFKKISENLSKPKILTTDHILSTFSPSSQICYSAKFPDVQLGSCIRQLWFDKNSYEKSNHNDVSPHVKIAGVIGNDLEDWMITQLKQLGLYSEDQIPAIDSANFVKGFVDVSIVNPLTGNIELNEIKTYDGGSFFGSMVYGTLNSKPQPKIKHLLQAYRYLMIHKDSVDAINLLYLDRSCSGWFKNKQFRVTLLTVDSEVYPQIEVIWKNGELCTYVETSITSNAIITSEQLLMSYLKSGEIPPKDFIEVYTSDEIETKFFQEKISKTAYDKYKKGTATSLGDHQCTYCPYSEGTCVKYG